MHDGIEDALAFISKSENALQNLNMLSRIISSNKLIKHVRLYSYFHRLKIWSLLWIINAAFLIIHSFIKKNLLSCNPSLLVFDLYRLHYFIKLKKRMIAE